MIQVVIRTLGSIGSTASSRDRQFSQARVFPAGRKALVKSDSRCCTRASARWHKWWRGCPGPGEEEECSSGYWDS
jgi:hypothetical protein